jgi:hypothetical protein
MALTPLTPAQVQALRTKADTLLADAEKVLVIAAEFEDLPVIVKVKPYLVDVQGFLTDVVEFLADA